LEPLDPFVVGTADGVCTLVSDSAGGGGEYSERNAYSTAKDKTKARMTRFSITNFYLTGSNPPWCRG